MPTKDEILVPETLLKKRKSQEKERQEKAAERENKKKVRRSQSRSHLAVMISTHTRLALRDAVVY